jgi:hypothetical protein
MEQRAEPIRIGYAGLGQHSGGLVDHGGWLPDAAGSAVGGHWHGKFVAHRRDEHEPGGVVLRRRGPRAGPARAAGRSLALRAFVPLDPAAAVEVEDRFMLPVSQNCLSEH